MPTWLSDRLNPVMLRAIIGAVFMLLFTLGVTASSEIPAWADTLIVIIGSLVPFIQGLLTRGKVTPTAKIEAALNEIREDPPISRRDALQVVGHLEGQLVEGSVPVRSLESVNTS